MTRRFNSFLRTAAIGCPVGAVLFLALFRGRVLSGGYTGDTTALSSLETESISSNPLFGIGHVMITATVSYNTEVLAETSEDGFLLGGRILLYYSYPD